MAFNGRCRAVAAGMAVAFVVAAGVGCGRSISAPPALRVATSGDYAPFSIASNGVPGGMDVEVAERLAQDLGTRVEFIPVAWPGLDAATQRGDFDIAMGGVTMRADRALVGRYTRPYATVGAVALVREAYATRFASADALDRPGVRIAVNAGGHLERVARARFAHATVTAVADNRAVLQRVIDGKADAALTDTAEQRTWQRPGVRAIGPFSFDHKAYLLPVGDAALAVRVDQWMVAREADGWLDGERVKWLGPGASMDAAAAGRESVAALAGLRLDLMPAVAAAKRAAGLPVEDRVQEDRVLGRVRGLASNPEHTAAVYRQLIELAKAVQRTAPAPQGAASLDELRAAIGRIDEQLVRELDRAPAGSVDLWRVTLQRSVNEPGVDTQSLNRLAEVLAQP
jgi:cyclohexadienyl dehydratase